VRCFDKLSTIGLGEFHASSAHEAVDVCAGATAGKDEGPASA